MSGTTIPRTKGRQLLPGRESISRTPRRGPRSASDWVVLIVLTLLAFCFAVPVYVAITNAVKPKSQSGLSFMWQWPNTFDPSSLIEAFNAMTPNLVSSLLVTLGATGLMVFAGSVNGYILAKLKFRGADVIMLILMFGMFIPYQAILTPLVKTLAFVGLYNSLPGLILVHFVYGIPLSTLIFRNFYSAIPDDILNAASIDGAGGLRTYLHIIAPLSGPGILVVFIYQFTNVWNSFLFGVVVVPNPLLQPVTVALKNVSSAQNVDWNTVMAASVIASLPTLLIYILFGRFFVSGLMAGALK